MEVFCNRVEVVESVWVINERACATVELLVVGVGLGGGVPGDSFLCSREAMVTLGWLVSESPSNRGFLAAGGSSSGTPECVCVDEC